MVDSLPSIGVASAAVIGDTDEVTFAAFLPHADAGNLLDCGRHVANMLLVITRTHTYTNTHRLIL